MIRLFASSPDAQMASLVLAAFRRSVTHGLAQLAAPASLGATKLAVCINPGEEFGERLWSWLADAPRKLIIFGAMPDGLCGRLAMARTEWPDAPDEWARSAPAPAQACTESDGKIVYREAAAALSAASWSRAMERFDFTDEWNNLAFGAIRMDGSPWALAAPLQAPRANVLADVVVGQQAVATFSGLFEVGGSSLLWFNRPVGPIDSFEWRLVERFLSDWRGDTQPCCPVVSEIPWGYDAAITMRLDCDEDITSAKPLWSAYREMGVPLSLAIHTSNLQEATHQSFLDEFCAAGGALLSHTATHASNWGGSYEAALGEGRESHDRIRAATGVSVGYAVSPFHQSPSYALAGLCDAGYRGCIGGIIRNDPEFLLARGGELANMPRGFIGHSQQTMMHGDCMLAEGDPLRIFKATFDRACETRTFFGFLDHPFSERYQYGWSDELQRIEAHRQFIQHIRNRAAHPLFLDENRAMDFLAARAGIQLADDGDGFISVGAQAPAGLDFGIELRGRSHALKSADRFA